MVLHLTKKKNLDNNNNNSNDNHNNNNSDDNNNNEYSTDPNTDGFSLLKRCLATLRNLRVAQASENIVLSQ